MEKKKYEAVTAAKNLSPRAYEKFVKELDLFFCNTCLPKSDQEKLVKMINKLLD